MFALQNVQINTECVGDSPLYHLRFGIPVNSGSKQIHSIIVILVPYNVGTTTLNYRLHGL